ncbi:hypothetical protein J437_LFUL008980, partial [Ladona fulva]
PRRIVISSCDGRVNQRKGVQPAGGKSVAGNLELEEYASPGERTFYRIHPSYLKDSKKAIIEFVGSGYGEARICMTRYRPDEPRGMLREANCRNMSTDVASFTLQDPCPGGTPYSGNCLPRTTAGSPIRFASPFGSIAMGLRRSSAPHSSSSA